MRVIKLADLRLADWILSDEVIGWPQGPGEPLALTETLVQQRADLRNVGLLFGLTQSATLTPDLGESFAFHALNGAGTSRKVTGHAEVYPGHVSQIPALLRQGVLPLDVVLVQVARLDDRRFTLGVISDFTHAMVQRARCVIALLNPSLPAMQADAVVDAADIDVLVEADHRIIDLPDPLPSEVERQVAMHVASLIPDRATLQLGVGTLPAAVAEALLSHQALGIHSGVVSDVLVDLVERGIVTNAYKGRDTGKTITGGLFGTQRLRNFAQDSGLIEMRSADYTHSLAVTASIPNFYTINSAIEVDATGQVNSEIAAGRYLGAVGGQVDFVRAGVASEGGSSIIAFPSTTLDGKSSRIVTSLAGRPVTTARSDVDVIVTEYGVARLRGVGLKERSRRLIAIAHPTHRDALAASLMSQAI